MIQTIWFSFLFCIVSAENGTVFLPDLDPGNIPSSNLYFSDSFNILDKIDLEPILGLNTNISESFSQLFENEDLSTEEFGIETDSVTAENSELCVLQSPSITDEKNYECPMSDVL
ncbi:hypothetical protein WUBG_15250 [Wuchereria bancrofti]|uniref:Uncharacterized protein n=1 Tax=Wuchereria bancrofti TaxID=6293 RepID=J9DVY6_WUCBA|nr:hypothetical protein WUBG_15250 [Wuchereria bancrofti]